MFCVHVCFCMCVYVRQITPHAADPVLDGSQVLKSISITQCVSLTPSMQLSVFFYSSPLCLSFSLSLCVQLNTVGFSEDMDSGQFVFCIIVLVTV